MQPGPHAGIQTPDDRPDYARSKHIRGAGQFGVSTSGPTQARYDQTRVSVAFDCALETNKSLTNFCLTAANFEASRFSLCA